MGNEAEYSTVQHHGRPVAEFAYTNHPGTSQAGMIT